MRTIRHVITAAHKRRWDTHSIARFVTRWVMTQLKELKDQGKPSQRSLKRWLRDNTLFPEDTPASFKRGIGNKGHNQQLFNWVKLEATIDEYAAPEVMMGGVNGRFDPKTGELWIEVKWDGGRAEYEELATVIQNVIVHELTHARQHADDPYYLKRVHDQQDAEALVPQVTPPVHPMLKYISKPQETPAFARQIKEIARQQRVPLEQAVEVFLRQYTKGRRVHPDTVAQMRKRLQQELGL